jgi:hypothetical protein
MDSGPGCLLLQSEIQPLEVLCLGLSGIQSLLGKRISAMTVGEALDSIALLSSLEPLGIS